MIPQLRVRTEHSHRKTFAPIGRAVEALAAAECPAAGIVDTSGSWGHVRWEQACTKNGVQPMFGAEIKVPVDEFKPSCWALARKPRDLYRTLTRVFAEPENALETILTNREGLVVFAGAALTDPDHFDYIDLNPASPVLRRRSLALHRRTGKPLVITSDNWCATRGDVPVMLALTGENKTTPTWLLTEDELRAAMPELTVAEFDSALANVHEIAEQLRGVKLATAPMIHFEGDLDAVVSEGKRRRLTLGHIEEWTEAYELRLKHEMQLIRDKDFESYFLVVSDLVNWAKQHMLVGPARGSSAGSLVCYLTGITEVDPIQHKLIFERFIDVNRADLPDIDIDFSDKKRDMVFDYLREKYGNNNVARIGNHNTLKPRSVMAEIGKRLGVPAYETFAVRNVMIEYSSGDSRYGNALEDTLTVTAPGREFKEKYPKAAEYMAVAEGHAWHTGVHAAGVIVCNEPVSDFCTINKDGVAHIDKKDSECLNLLKIDVLGLRTLGVIEDAEVVTPDELYGLKLNDPAVLEIFNEARFAGIFQFEGAAQRRVSVQTKIDSFAKIDHITALARPGPLGGGAAGHYMLRSAGKEPVTYKHPLLAEQLADTYGVVLYQEQVMRIVRELGKFSWAKTSEIRKAMSGRKGKEYFDKRGEQFIEGAATLGIDAGLAQEVWDEICTFGAWGMNKSHTVSYAIISYWCAYLKRYHPLEFAAALLRNAKDEEQMIEVLRELDKEGIRYTPFDLEKSAVDWAVVDGELVGGFKNLHGVGPAKAVMYTEKRRLGKLTEKDVERINAAPVACSDLRPAHRLWSKIYDDPKGTHNIRGTVKEFADLEDSESAAVIARLVRLERRDENETVRAARRGFQKSGQTLFLDMFVVDDSISKPVLARIKTNRWFEWGEPLADRAIAGEEWFLMRGRWLKNYSMLSVQKIKCLTNPELFNEAS